MRVDRRQFCAGTVATVALGANGPVGAHQALPIIDTHIHLFDATRPQGAPYGGPPAYTTHVARPSDYRPLAVPLGIVGAIAVEASPWIEDNLWLVETAAADPIIVGVIGNLRPEQPDFLSTLERYRKIPLFRGIRYGNLWNYNLVEQAANPDFIAALKHLAEADLVLDTANPRVELLQALLRINDRVPDLRIVIDHLPSLDPAPDMQGAYDAVLAEIEGRANISAKLSEIYHKHDGEVAQGLASYRERLDRLMDVFGEDRVMFGSDWPNSVGTAALDQITTLVEEYFAAKPRSVAEKYFWKNSARIYKWIKRAPLQPNPV